MAIMETRDARVRDHSGSAIPVLDYFYTCPGLSQFACIDNFIHKIC